MTCKECTHWNLQKSPMRSAGMGTCKADRSQFAAARTLSPGNICRIDSFKQAEAATVAARVRALG